MCCAFIVFYKGKAKQTKVLLIIANVELSFKQNKTKRKGDVMRSGAQTNIMP